jgi:glucokinase
MVAASLVLAGDVGGTKTLLALYHAKDGHVAIHRSERYDSKAYPTLQEMAREFVGKDKHLVTAACFGVPGPVSDGTVRTTNLPWRLTEFELADNLRIPRVRLVNDLVATAASLPYLGSLDYITLHPGAAVHERDAFCVIAPGTGLGQAVMYREPGRTILLGSEGGHADFAPRSEREIALLTYLMKKFGRVSVERIISGPGILNIYSFLRDTAFAPESEELAEAIRLGDPSAAIGQAAVKGSDPLAIETLSIFMSVLGAHAGNMMLTYLASGGIYIAGGIPGKILSLLKEGDVVSSYLAKGRLSPLVEATPLYVVKDPLSGLHGAAYLASEM